MKKIRLAIPKLLLIFNRRFSVAFHIVDYSLVSLFQGLISIEAVNVVKWSNREIDQVKKGEIILI